MKTKMTFSKHCAFCQSNKKIHKSSMLQKVVHLLRQARGYIDGGDYSGNEVQANLATEIDSTLGKVKNGNKQPKT